MTAVLKITDGTTTVNLLDRSGYMLSNWRRGIAGYKGGGTWQDGSLANGRQIVDKKWENVIETLELKAVGESQDMLIRYTQDLRRLLEKASDYWTTSWQDEIVWIEVKASKESNAEYAWIYHGRIPEDGNPFSQPFLQRGCKAVMDELVLLVERGPWLGNKPGTADAMAIAGVQYGWEQNQVLNGSFEIAGGAPPVFQSWDENVGGGAITRDTTRYLAGGASCRLVQGGANRDTYIHQTIAVTSGETRNLTFFSLASMFHRGAYLVYDVTNGANIIPLTNIPVGNTWQKVSVDINIPATCVSLRIYFYCSPIGWSIPVYFDAVSLEGYPTMGKIETDTPDEVFIANKCNVAQLTDIWYWDNAPAPGWTGNLLGAAKPTQLLPNIPAVDDFILFGIDSTADDTGPLSNLIFNLTTAQTGLTIEWRFSNDADGVDPSAWRVIANLQDSTITDDPLDTEGVVSMFFDQGDQLANWAALNPQVGANPALGVTGYWIAAYVTAGPGTPPSQGDADDEAEVYTTTWANAEIEQLSGDILALGRVWYKNRSVNRSFNGLENNYVVMGTRKISRGNDFRAFINVSWDTQLPAGVTFVDWGVDAPAVDDDAPSGISSTWSPAGPLTDATQFGIAIEKDYMWQWRGKYHVYARVNQTAGTLGDFSLRTMLYVGNTHVFTGQSGDVLTMDKYCLVDLGTLDLATWLAESDLPRCRLYILGTNLSAAADGDLTHYDIILMPTDEWAGRMEKVERDGNATTTWGVIDVDSISRPKSIVPIQTMYRAWEDGYTYTEGYYPIAHGPLEFDINRQNLWTLFAYGDEDGILLSNPFIGNSLSMWKTQRYLGMRGSR